MGRIALTPSKDLEGTDEQLDLRVRPRRVKRVEFPPMPSMRTSALLSAAAIAAVAAAPPAAAQDLAASRRTAIVTAAARVAPAVVSVNVLRRERQLPQDPFDLFFRPRGYEQTVEGYGSGFIISSDGLVITNQHVTQGAEQIVVTTRDGRDFPAKILGEDPLTDIAVLKVEATSLPTAPLGKSGDLMIGEWVVAFGNPFAYLLGNSEPTVTAGVVSAVGRNLLPSEGQSGIYVGMIQTDAPINPGNSGGPLANALGEVVGVNSSIFTSSGGSVGIGFAIPIERALRVADELRRYGKVRPAGVEAGGRPTGDPGGRGRTGRPGGRRGGRCAGERPRTATAHLPRLGSGHARHGARRHTHGELSAWGREQERPACGHRFPDDARRKSGRPGGHEGGDGHSGGAGGAKHSERPRCVDL